MIDEKKLIAEIREKIIPEKFGERCNALDVIYAVLRVIDEQPKVGEWIPCLKWMPCNARLPKYGEDVEVTTKDGDRLIGHYAGGCWYDSIDGNYIRVAAWKEPSEPWKGEE